MSKITNKRRAFVIRRKRNRHKNVQRLKVLYQNARTAADKKKIMEKIIRFAPYLNPDTQRGEKK
ncbi:MAG: hypothetical protein A3B30_02175 [Candidatus Komeilibacteria bacterium RIFCSPLOWO2_01_FULL_52_15]|uniref:30S ribosomal protein S20 n=1 Tax=Candidatus Komeilibacteria bacterium RIFCSPLOWO2_01_FULL_52_15 TaxID=1798551 RepID=A0A1G2BSK3_9BACT|nr:MAG: hypothetical protein A3B30_02175 [Candidatus Komeilibacteria bacterium RIFCSPLOWO2_01_FULL_52_15]